MKLEFPPQIFGKTQISNFMKIRPPGGELFHANGQIREAFRILRKRLKHIPAVQYITMVMSSNVFAVW